MSLTAAIDRLCATHGIAKSDAIAACERAVHAAAEDVYGDARRYAAEYDPATGEVALEVVYRVVDEIDNPNVETTADELARVDTEAEPGETLGFPIWYLPHHADIARVQDAQFGAFLGLGRHRQAFGRRAVEAARGALAGLVAGARGRATFAAFAPIVGEIVLGRVTRLGRGGTAMIALGGRVTGVIPRSEQHPRDNLTPGQSVIAVVEEVAEDGPTVTLSRASDGFVAALLPLICPEVASGRVEVAAVAREAGGRTKIAVRTVRGEVDPVAAVVGEHGAYVRDLRASLLGEQVDVCEWTYSTFDMAAYAFAPGIGEWRLDGPEFDDVSVYVATEDMAIAVGPRGVNVRLASQLAGVEIEVKEIEG